MRIFYALLFAVLTALVTSCADTAPAGTATIRSGKTVYVGQTAGGKPDGYGVLMLGDSIVYSGQWKAGRRCGYGTAADSLGRMVTALWSADTIVRGHRADSAGVYTGEFDSCYIASGHGVYEAHGGAWYDGAWRGGMPDGFGCGVTHDGKVQVGEWAAGRYRGERMTYTAERIYGIDISRYQHGKGRKKYAINWGKLRITHLGDISRKKVSGQVDYPVSFVYIKSTEGASVRNPYYLSDYRKARRHGIAVGAYHFFSPTSDASRQANYFLRNSRFAKGDLPPVLDVEPTTSQVRKMGGTEAMFSRIRTWLGIVRKRTGVRPILYVSQQFVNKYLPSAPDIMRDYMVWIARYGEYRPDVRLVFWQLCPDGRVSGIRGDVDINVFNGYHDSFGKFIKEETIR